jgi:CheY-like chemotaxis protein
VNFLFSATFIWGDRRGGGRALLRRWVSFHGAILGTAALNQAMYVVAQLVLPPLVAAALGIAAAALVNFLIQDRFVFVSRRFVSAAEVEGERGRRTATACKPSVRALPSLPSQRRIPMQPRILFVEESPYLSHLFAPALADAGFAVTPISATDITRGARADASPSLNLLSAMGDPEHAIATCRAIRCNTQVPLIVLAARADDALLIGALDAGADDIVIVPCMSRELAARIRAVLRPFIARPMPPPMPASAAA